MVVIASPEKDIADQTRKKLGRAYQYGQRIYSKTRYGEQEILIGHGQYGMKIYGIEKYGEVTSYYGVYRIQPTPNGQIIIKQKFYIPSNPQTVPQQANRSIFADAVSTWQGLTDEQKEVYNKKTKYKNLSGYNLYLSEYLLSH